MSLVSPHFYTTRGQNSLPNAKQAHCDPPPSKIVLMADAAMVNLAVDKWGRTRVNCWSFARPVVVLPGQILEVKWQAGPVVVLQRGTAKK